MRSVLLAAIVCACTAALAATETSKFHDPPTPPTCGVTHPLLSSAGHRLAPLGSMMSYADYHMVSYACDGFNSDLRHWSCCPPEAVLFLTDAVLPVAAPLAPTGNKMAHKRSLSEIAAEWTDDVENGLLTAAGCDLSAATVSAACQSILRARHTAEELNKLSKSSANALMTPLGACGQALGARLAGISCMLCSPWPEHFALVSTRPTMQIADSTSAADRKACQDLTSRAQQLRAAVSSAVAARLSTAPLDADIFPADGDLSTTADSAAAAALGADPLPYEQLLWQALPATPAEARRLAVSHAPPAPAAPVPAATIDVVSCDLDDDTTIQSHCQPLLGASGVGGALFQLEEASGQLGRRLGVAAVTLILALLL